MHNSLRFFVLVSAGLATTQIEAQQLLVRRSSAPEPGSLSVKVPSGPVSIQLSPVSMNPALLVVIAPRGLEASSYDQVKTFLTSLYQKERGDLSIQLATLGADGLRIAAPLRSPAELQAVLRSTREELVHTQEGTEAEDLATLAGALPDSLSAWSSILCISHFQPLSAATDEFAGGYLLQKFLSRKYRVMFWDPQQLPVPTYAANVARNSAGAVFTDAQEAIDFLSDSGQAFAVTWDEARLSHGFDLLKIQVNGGDSGAIMHASSAAALPTVGLYTKLREAVTAAESALTKPDYAAAHAALDGAFAINSLDRAALAAALNLADREKDIVQQAALLSASLELDPGSGALWSRLADAQFRLSDSNTAESSLMRARELGSANATNLEELGRIRVARADFRNGGAFLEESLKADPSRQAVWFLAAQAAKKLSDSTRQAALLEKGLALGGTNPDTRIELIEIYLARSDLADASRHVDLGRSQLGPDAGLLSRWADFYSRLDRADDALSCWKEVIRLDAKREPAHFAIIRNLLARKQYDAALTAADTALESVTSTRVQTLKGSTLDALGRIYEARNYVESLKDAQSDTDFAKLRADLSDRFGGPAGNAYRMYAERLLEAKSTDLQTVLERGWRVCIREGDAKNADWFAAQLKPTNVADSAVAKRAIGQQGFWLPGGIDGLMFIARGSGGVAPDRFLVEYSRTLLANERGQNAANVLLYRKAISAYFEQLKQLLAMGVREKNQTIITLSLADKQATRRTEAVIGLLGWKLKREKQRVSLESGDKASQARKQDLPAALALDQSGMEAALVAGKPYRLEIAWDWVPLIIDEKMWRTFAQPEKLAGGIPEAFSRDLNLPKLYVAFSNVDEPTARTLLSALDLRTLLDRYADRFSFYSPALAVTRGRVVVPGGPSADAVWTKMCGASPTDAAGFLRALFDKNEGKLFAYFFTLSQLDTAHQRFFTANASRADSFYRLFADSIEMQHGPGHYQQKGTFADFFREIPLVDGAVDFPGSAEVWMYAKGRSKSAAGTQRLMKKVRKAIAPEMEDEVLLRIARTKYKATEITTSELDNFLAVSRIDAHRADSLDENAALILAQNYAAYSAFYPYFSVFRNLTASDFEAFFTFAGKAELIGPVEANTVLGQFHSLVEVTRLGLESGRISDSRAAEIFRSICTRFQAAQDGSAYTLASLDTVRDLIRSAPAKDADDSLAELVLGHVAAATFDWKDTTVTLDAGKSRLASYSRVLDLQKAGSIEAVLRIEQAGRNLISSPATGLVQIAVMEKERARFPSVEILKAVKGKGTAKRSLEGSAKDGMPQLLAKFRRAVSAKKVSQDDLGKLYRALLLEITPQVRLALSGVVYAAYLDPEDALVANDPLLLRKHQFFSLEVKTGRFSSSELRESSEAQGSFLSGGFGQFGYAAGLGARVGAARGKKNSDLFAKEIGSIRMSPWSRYHDSDQQQLGLRLRLVREWFVYAADNAALLTAVSEDTAGVLSLTRRRELLSAIEDRNWNIVWATASLSDLYFLSDRYLARYPRSPWNSPVDSALRNVLKQNDGSNLRVLGGVAASIAGCNHAHLQLLAPYEEYEVHIFTAEMAERLSEIKLYLSQSLDAAALPAAVLPAIAEFTARRVLAGMQMSDERDWAGALKAYRTIDAHSLGAAIDKR